MSILALGSLRVNHTWLISHRQSQISTPVPDSSRRCPYRDSIKIWLRNTAKKFLFGGVIFYSWKFLVSFLWQKKKKSFINLGWKLLLWIEYVGTHYQMRSIWGVKDGGRGWRKKGRDVNESLILLGIKLLAWWPGGHFSFLLDSISIKGMTPWLVFAILPLILHFKPLIGIWSLNIYRISMEKVWTMLVRGEECKVAI